MQYFLISCFPYKWNVFLSCMLYCIICYIGCLCWVIKGKAFNRIVLVKWQSRISILSEFSCWKIILCHGVKLKKTFPTSWRNRLYSLDCPDNCLAYQARYISVGAYQVLHQCAFCGWLPTNTIRSSTVKYPTRTHITWQQKLETQWSDPRHFWDVWHRLA